MKLPIVFNNIPAGCEALVESARQPARLEFTLRKGQDTPTIEDSVKQFAREVVAANESNGYRMSIGTFLDLWRKN
jgi:hypothetical protein